MTQDRSDEFYWTAGLWVRSAIAVVALAAGLGRLRAAITRSAGPLLSGSAPDWRGALDAASADLMVAAGVLLVAHGFAVRVLKERRWRRVYAPLLGQFAAGELEPLRHRPASSVLLADERVRNLSRDLGELCRVGTTASRLEHALDVYLDLLDRCESDPTAPHGLSIVEAGMEIRSVLDEAAATARGRAS